MVAVYQPVPCHLGPERMSTGISTLPGVRHQGSLPADRRDSRQQDDARQLSVGACLTYGLAAPDRLVALHGHGVGPPSTSFFQVREPPPIAISTPPFRGVA